MNTAHTMGDKSKKILADREVARRFEEDKRRLEEQTRNLQVRCACCKRSEKDGATGFLDMGPFIACYECIELAYREVRLKRGK